MISTRLYIVVRFRQRKTYCQRSNKICKLSYDTHFFVQEKVSMQRNDQQYMNKYLFLQVI